MLERITKATSGIPVKRLVIVGFVLMTFMMMLTSGAAAQSTDPNSTDPVNDPGNLTEDQEDLRDALYSIGNFVSLIILGVAVPNGAYGFLQYMTAGSNVDQDEKGRKRIRNTFIALAGVAVIQLAVRVFTTYVSIGSILPF